MRGRRGKITPPVVFFQYNRVVRPMNFIFEIIHLVRTQHFPKS